MAPLKWGGWGVWDVLGIRGVWGGYGDRVKMKVPLHSFYQPTITPQGIGHTEGNPYRPAISHHGPCTV